MDLIMATLGSSLGTFLSYVIPFVLVLTVIVFFHEFGHFLVARWCGVSIEAFSIGFGREIFGWTDRHGTRWKIAWLPLGGYVKFEGDANAASLPTVDARREHASASPGDYHGKPVWQRSLVVVAGPVANFILAIVIFAAAYAIVGVPISDPKIEAVKAGSAAQEAGFRPGDVIKSIDGEKIRSFNQVQKIIAASAGVRLTITVERDGHMVPLDATPKRIEVSDGLGGKIDIGQLGVKRVSVPTINAVMPGSAADKAGLRPGDVIKSIDGQAINSFNDVQRIAKKSAGVKLTITVERKGKAVAVDVTPRRIEADNAQGGKVAIGQLGVSGSDAAAPHYERQSPVEAVALAVGETRDVSARLLGYIRGIIMGRQSADQLSGPIGIARMTRQVASVSFDGLVQLVAVLSISIGLINLFPIPMLDGGHLVYYAIELVRGKPLGPAAQEMGYKVGLFLVMALMLVATFNDLSRLRLF